jgi:hypothetical protein
MKSCLFKRLFAVGAIAIPAALPLASPSSAWADDQNQVLEWNQVFVDTLVATNTPNASSQRLGAIVHSAIFDAFNGIEHRYTPIYVQGGPPAGASRRAAVIAAAYTALVGLFPSRQAALDASYAASLAALSDDGEDGGESRERGIAWGRAVALAILAWRSTDGFNGTYEPFYGGIAIGQWQPTPPGFGAMSAQALAHTSPFVVPSAQFQPAFPRGLLTQTYADDFNAVKTLGRRTGSTRTAEQTSLAPFWEGNASVHWNQAANQMCTANHVSLSDSSRLFAVLNIAMADTAFTVWRAKLFYGTDFTAVTWRPVTAIPLADYDANPDTASDADWLPLVTTPSHPEYPAGHPAQNGAAATVLLTRFADAQTFTLTTRTSAGVDLPSRLYTSISAARGDGNNARVWGGMHYPSTVAVSDRVGAAIANYVNLNAMQALRGSQE